MLRRKSLHTILHSSRLSTSTRQIKLRVCVLGPYALSSCPYPHIRSASDCERKQQRAALCDRLSLSLECGSMWQPLLPALLLIHASWATLFSEGGPQELYYPDDEYIPRGNVQYDPEKLAEVIEQLNKDADLQRGRTRAVFDEDDQRTNAMEIELTRSIEGTEKPMSAQKKGQSEFVEFIEPKAASQLKQVETLEKRVPVPKDAAPQSSRLIHTGNFFFIAVATVCIVGAVVGAVSGAYYYRAWRMQQAAAERSDFTHYAPAGPGKEKKKKRGDESLAYKAQLHHYQQTKQKIISGEELGAGMPDNDETSEASDDEGNNFSVYECPGLAPTGDIEVQNPNFDSRP